MLVLIELVTKLQIDDEIESEHILIKFEYNLKNQICSNLITQSWIGGEQTCYYIIGPMYWERDILRGRISLSNLDCMLME